MVDVTKEIITEIQARKIEELQQLVGEQREQIRQLIYLLNQLKEQYEQSI